MIWFKRLKTIVNLSITVLNKNVVGLSESWLNPIFPSYKNKKRKVERDVLIWTRAENFSKNSEEKGSSGLNWSRSNLLNIIKIKKERMGKPYLLNWIRAENCVKKINCLASAMRHQFLIFTLFSVDILNIKKER